jgi:hypothetical protein
MVCVWCVWGVWRVYGVYLLVWRVYCISPLRKVAYQLSNAVIIKAFGMESSLSRYMSVDKATTAGLEHLCSTNTFTPDKREVKTIHQRIAILDHFRPQYCAAVGKDLSALIETRRHMLRTGKQTKKRKMYVRIYIYKYKYIYPITASQTRHVYRPKTTPAKTKAAKTNPTKKTKKTKKTQPKAKTRSGSRAHP